MMEEKEEKSLRFVLEQYVPGKFDTRRALHRFRVEKEWENDARRVRKLRLYRWTAGVAASLLLVIGSYFYISRMEEEAAWTRVAAADTEVRYLLPDSTWVTLSPRSTLSYRTDRYGRKERAVRMEGRVWFDVRSNPGQPFRIRGRRAAVEVLGTRFYVEEQRADSVAEVYVDRGKVRFAAVGHGDGLILTRGMQARLPLGEETPQAVRPDTPNPAAWALHTFHYDETPLEEVLKELSAFYRVSLSTRYSGKLLTADFDTTNLEEIILLIEQSLDVKIERR